MSRRVRRVRALVCIALGLLLAAAFGMRVTAARAQTTLGSYTIIAAAPGIEGTEDEPSAQAHPEGHGAAPYTTSMLTTGDYGYSLATIAWPGATAGNAGSLLLVALPSQVGGVPVPDAARDGAKTAGPALQYPIRAESRAGSTPEGKYDQIPGTTLTSHADPTNALATANVEGATQEGAATYGNMHSESSSTINGSSAKATASSLIQDVDIGGGAVKIKSVTSNAIATTSAGGSGATASGGTVVQGMTIGGQKVYLDDKGLQLGEPGKPQNTNVVVAQAVNQVVTNMGMKFYVSQPHGETVNGVTTYNAGSVVMTWEPPSNPSKNVFVVTFGGASVTVAAGEGFGAGGNEEPTPAATDTGTGGDTGTAALGASTDVPTDTGTLAGGTTDLPAATTPGGGSSGGAQNINGTDIAATFGGIGIGWLLIALAAAVLLGVGSRRLLTDLVDKPAAATCPLEVQR